MVKRILVSACAGALLLALAAGAPGQVSAANLSGGTYTYVVNGEESNFIFDPIQMRDGWLLPLELFQRFGVTTQANSKDLTLRKAEVEARLTLGSTTVSLNGRPELAQAAPLRLNGRVFLPADLLKYFGVEFSLTDHLVVLEDYGETMPPITPLTEGEYLGLRTGRTITQVIKADSETSLQAEFLLLSPELASAANLSLEYGARARVQRLAQTHSLVWVRLRNGSFKAGALVAKGLYLVDQQRKQYPLVGMLDVGDGLVDGLLVPNAERVGILFFPQVATEAGALSLYYEPNAATLGTFNRIR